MDQKNLTAKLLDLVEGRETPESWRNWWDEHETELEALLSRGEFLKLKPCRHDFQWVPVLTSQKGAIAILEKSGTAFEASNLYQERYLAELDAFCKEQKRVQREKQKEFKANNPELFCRYPKFSKALAKALEMTGAGKLVADQVIGLLGNNSSPFMLLVVVFALSVVMTNFMSNTATVALLVPVSLSIAAGMGADPRAVLMATVIGSSCAYATPIGMPANMMVLSAGGYKFVDYAKSGIPLIIVSTIVSLILLPILFPFHP